MAAGCVFIGNATHGPVQAGSCGSRPDELRPSPAVQQGFQDEMRRQHRDIQRRLPVVDCLEVHEHRSGWGQQDVLRREVPMRQVTLLRRGQVPRQLDEVRCVLRHQGRRTEVERLDAQLLQDGAGLGEPRHVGDRHHVESSHASDDRFENLRV
jgi:hypothetical protein